MPNAITELRAQESFSPCAGVAAHHHTLLVNARARVLQEPGVARLQRAAVTLFKTPLLPADSSISAPQHFSVCDQVFSS
jgi:hypothetical protein